MSYVMKGDKLTQTAEPTTPEPTTQAESAFEEWCPVCGASAVVRLAPGWDDGRAIPIIGCGNPWHYVYPAPAEARDTTGLREALDAHNPATNAPGPEWCSCGWRPTGPIQWGRGVWADHREEAVRAALTAPPEPRWPSRDELANALEGLIADLRQYHDGGIHSGAALDGMIFDARAILAALREGAERP